MLKNRNVFDALKSLALMYPELVGMPHKRTKVGPTVSSYPMEACRAENSIFFNGKGIIVAP